MFSEKQIKILIGLVEVQIETYEDLLSNKNFEYKLEEEIETGLIELYKILEILKILKQF